MNRTAPAPFAPAPSTDSDHVHAGVAEVSR